MAHNHLQTIASINQFASVTRNRLTKNHRRLMSDWVANWASSTLQVCRTRPARARAAAARIRKEARAHQQAHHDRACLASPQQVCAQSRTSLLTINADRAPAAAVAGLALFGPIRRGDTRLRRRTVPVPARPARAAPAPSDRLGRCSARCLLAGGDGRCHRGGGDDDGADPADYGPASALAHCCTRNAAEGGVGFAAVQVRTHPPICSPASSSFHLAVVLILFASLSLSSQALLLLSLPPSLPNSRLLPTPPPQTL